jgi:hypothetical protein
MYGEINRKELSFLDLLQCDRVMPKEYTHEKKVDVIDYFQEISD